MKIQAILHPIARLLACDDVSDVGHRKNALCHRSTFRLSVVFDSIGCEHDFEVEWTIRELNEVFASNNLTLHRVIDHESQMADGSDEAATIVGILGRKCEGRVAMI